MRCLAQGRFQPCSATHLLEIFSGYYLRPSYLRCLWKKTVVEVQVYVLSAKGTLKGNYMKGHFSCLHVWHSGVVTRKGRYRSPSENHQRALATFHRDVNRSSSAAKTPLTWPAFISSASQGIPFSSVTSTFSSKFSLSVDSLFFLKTRKKRSCYCLDLQHSTMIPQKENCLFS